MIETWVPMQTVVAGDYVGNVTIRVVIYLGERAPGQRLPLRPRSAGSSSERWAPLTEPFVPVSVRR